MRTTIYLTGPAAEALERVRAAYMNQYGIAITVSSVFARLLLGETIAEVIERPYRQDLARIAGEIDRLRDELRRDQTRRRANTLHRIHREVAGLYPPVKQVSTTLGRGRRRTQPSPPDLVEAARLEERLDELMAACADALAPARRR